jgi:hypothetical protein
MVFNHAAYMRRWRRLHPLSEEQRRRDSARSYAGVYRRRGLLEPEPCIVCGAPEVEMHHADYRRPLDVKWLCRFHHLELTAIQRRVARRARETS